MSLLLIFIISRWPYCCVMIILKHHSTFIFSENIVEIVHNFSRGSTMQNFDDLDIEGRNPSHLSEADKEKVMHNGNYW